MKVYDIILKKRNGFSLTRNEIEYFVDGYADGFIPDYQAAALAMAIYFQGMDEEETACLTMAMANSGTRVDLSDISGIKVDKHSTGGVGDTTTLVLVPLAAAAGLPVAKMSGRGLGHTGGTLDKLESIPGFCSELSILEIKTVIKKSGLVLVAQAEDLVPADKKLYALRDVTATVDSMSLIAASIMSKKIAAGADALVLDVKVGSGAFIQEIEQAYKLAQIMTDIGMKSNLRTAAVITRMDQPLGRAVGNALEIEEAILTLCGEGPTDLEKLCLHLGGWMLYLSGKSADPYQGESHLKGLIQKGAGLDKFRELVKNQGGDERVIDDLSQLPQAAEIIPVKAASYGFVGSLEAKMIGEAAMKIGAGRDRKDAQIDPAVGITLEKKIGDAVKKGEILAYVHANRAPEQELIAKAVDMVFDAYTIKKDPVKLPEIILGCVE
ncbi:MAG: pyrimidine-nucleoside phosphorylase [Bacillota bacterium]